jgi:TusA-related sulfurtransferase
MEPTSEGTMTFDMRGQICPSTLLTALKEVNDHRATLQAGSQSLCFLTDNVEATVTIPESVENMGYQVKVTRRKGYYVIEVGGKGPRKS